MKMRGMLLLVAILAVGTLSGSFAARANSLGPPPISLIATSSVGGDVLSLTPTAVANPDGSFSVAEAETVPSFSLSIDLTVRTDPTVAGSFTLTNLSSTTQFFSVSATLGILPIPGPQTRIGGFYGDVTYTDANGDSSVTIATNGVDPFYAAQIDGVTVVGLGSFNNTAFGGPHVFGTISQQLFGTPIPSAVGPQALSSIGVAFPAFSVTPGDSIQVPFEFVVENGVPEPSFASLFATGTALILLARNCKKFFSSAQVLW
ncbi:MAG TPA: hypothetical protein VMR31_05150 [Myxococcota bacterium]|nr:hypothetical protein [Myxococcota bacterium]